MLMKLQISSIWKKKKIDMKSGRIWTHEPENLDSTLTTRPLRIW